MITTDFPSIPPAAALVGLNKCLYSCAPRITDVCFDNAPDYLLYAGSSLSNTVSPPEYFGTSSDGKLRMIYPGTGVIQMSTQKSLKSVTIDKQVGCLPYAIGAHGLHMQARLRMSTNDPDCFNAFFSMPQQHDTIQSDSNPAFFPKYEQWHEFDYYESGHGTDQNGYYRGGYLQWAGKWNASFKLAAAPAKGATQVTLKDPWAGETGGWTVKLSTGESHSIKLIEGNLGPYTIDAVKNEGNTADAIIGYTRLLQSAVINKTPFDATEWHLYAGTYDPWRELFYISIDNVVSPPVSTHNDNSPNAFRDSLSYYPIFMVQSHGKGVASCMDIDYFSCWTS